MEKTEVILLGCGSSVGVPRIDGYWGRVNKRNLKNSRTRCSVFIRYKNINILIDTSPDIRNQLLKNKITKIDSVIYTHDHADQTHGINAQTRFRAQVGTTQSRMLHWRPSSVPSDEGEYMMNKVPMDCFGDSRP